MDWVETPGKGRNASALLREFEERFTRLLMLDRTVLDTSHVLLFVKAVDARDRDKVGLLLETDDGLTSDWAVVKRVCNHSTNCENGITSIGPTTRGIMRDRLTQSDETRR